MSPMMFQVTAQGVDPDLTCATGGFDSMDLGQLGTRRLEEVINAVSRMTLPEGFAEGRDVCPPQLIIHGPMGEHILNLADDDGTLYCDSTGGNLDRTQAMMLITGQPGQSNNQPEPTRLAQTSVLLTHCPECREPLESGDRFCAGCGSAVPEGEDSVNPPSVQSEPVPAGKKRKVGNGNRVNRETGKSLDELSHDVIQLMARPLPLHQYRQLFPYLLTGATGKTWSTLKEFMFRQDPPAPIHTRLTSPICDWALQKPGFFRRMMTLIIDLPILLVLFSIGIRNGPAICRSLGFARDSLGEGVIMISYFLISLIGYFTVTELIFGASLGGLLLGIRVVNDFGGTPSVGFLIMRQVWKILDVVAMFMGGTARVRLPPTMHVTIPIPEFVPGNVVIR